MTDLLDLIREDEGTLLNTLRNFMKSNYNDEEYWDYLTRTMTIPDDFIIQYYDSINFSFMLRRQKMNVWDNQMILNKIMADGLVNMLVNEQMVSERCMMYLITNMMDDVEFWRIISDKHKLSERFMDMYRDKLDWEAITEKQTYSNTFLLRNKDKIKWALLHMNENYDEMITDDIIGEILDVYRWVDINKMKVTKSKWLELFDLLDEREVDLLLDNDMVCDRFKSLSDAKYGMKQIDL